MRTRRGVCYPPVGDVSPPSEKRVVVKRKDFDGKHMTCRKGKRISADVPEESDLFGTLPDDLVIYILCKLSSTAKRPSDLINVLKTCKRLNGLGLHFLVLSKASQKVFAIRAKNWSESAQRFLKQCADSGNIDACYTLGMIQFYCLQNRESGEAMITKAADSSNAQALYSLAVIRLNGSGGSKNNKNRRAGVALCKRAASLDHIDALRELGHCLKDGYGARQNIDEGRRFLSRANSLELAAVNSSAAASGLPTRSCCPLNPHPPQQNMNCPLQSDYGCNVPAAKPHAANRFMAEWFAVRGRSPGPGLKLCSYESCGRPETRRHEFRQRTCQFCRAVNYCSRACQALDWKMRHKACWVLS